MHFSPQLPFDFSVSENFSFSNFLVSDKNVELLELLGNFSAHDDVITFIWGNKGVGKSHLLQALCYANDNANKNAIKNIKMDKYKYKYLNSIFKKFLNLGIIIKGII